jgi:hypothetical protein
MRKHLSTIAFAVSLAALAGHAAGQEAATRPKLRLDTIDVLEVRSAKLEAAEVPSPLAEIASYRGRRAVRLVNIAGKTAAGEPANGETIAILKGSDFNNGTIEADVFAAPRAGAQPGGRGFVGIAFRVAAQGSKYECISLRQLNGRADDQLRRNHSTQYSSYPDFPWHRLRDENPGVYESYVDIAPDEWTKIKIVVRGTKAMLYVNGADQPCLIVNELKLGQTRGQIALWVGTDTEGYFSNVTMK